MYNLVKRKVVVFDMKFCSHCGHELLDDAFVCPNCGCRVDGVKENINCESQKQDENDVLATVAKVSMILACVSSGILLLPLCWTIPMTMYYWKAIDNGEKVPMSFKICSLIFVNTIAGILMLCDTKH